LNIKVIVADLLIAGAIVPVDVKFVPKVTVRLVVSEVKIKVIVSPMYGSALAATGVIVIVVAPPNVPGTTSVFAQLGLVIIAIDAAQTGV
jgi:uncharacterized protein YpuA (DUF1002 family)